MSLPSGASIQPSEIQRVQAALDRLNPEHDEYDVHAARELSIKVNLHVHTEYPKVLYKGHGTSKSVSVNDAKAEEAARADGYSEHVPEPVKEA